MRLGSMSIARVVGVAMALALFPVSAGAQVPLLSDTEDLVHETAPALQLVETVPMIGAPADHRVAPSDCLARTTPEGCPVLKGGLYLPATPASAEDASRLLGDVVHALAVSSSCIGTADVNTCDGPLADQIIDLIQDAVGPPPAELCGKTLDDLICTAENLADAVWALSGGLVCADGTRIQTLCTAENVHQFVNGICSQAPDGCPSNDEIIATLMGLVTHLQGEAVEWAVPEEGFAGAYVDPDPTPPVGVNYEGDLKHVETNGECNFSAHPVERKSGTDGNFYVWTSSEQQCAFSSLHHGINVYLQRWESNYWANKAYAGDSGFGWGPPDNIQDYAAPEYDCNHKKTRTYRNHTVSWREVYGGYVVSKAANSAKTALTCPDRAALVELLPPLR